MGVKLTRASELMGMLPRGVAACYAGPANAS
jgi:hypothetical protein